MTDRGHRQSSFSEERLKTVFRSVFSLAPDEDLGRVRRKTFSKWDSVAHIQLLLEIEKQFGVVFALAEIETLETFEEFKSALKLRLST